MKRYYLPLFCMVLWVVSIVYFFYIESAISKQQLHIPVYGAILFYFTVSVTILLLLYWAAYYQKYITINFFINAALALTSLSISIIIAEVLLRHAGNYATYSETRSGNYQSFFLSQENNWFHTWLPNNTHYLETPEFSFKRNTNSLGYADFEPSLTKDSNELRIITIGDSFTEGDGADFDSSYPQILRRLLQTKYPAKKITMINAGVCGSDPYFDFMALKHRLVQLKPNIVINSFSGGDLFDIYYRGNFSRFQPNGTVKFNSPPVIEPFYAISHLFRGISHLIYYDLSLVPKFKKQQIFEKELKDISHLMTLYNELADRHCFKQVWLLRPDIVECVKGKFFTDYSIIETTDATLPNVSTFNLLHYYQNEKHLQGDMFKPYFWKVDNHHTAKGYRMMAEGVLSATLQAEQEVVD
jgi:hypothetical protein